MHSGTQGIQRDYATHHAYRPGLFRRLRYRQLHNRELLAPLLGLIMYVVLVLLLSAEMRVAMPATSDQDYFSGSPVSSSPLSKSSLFKPSRSLLSNAHISSSRQGRDS